MPRDLARSTRARYISLFIWIGTNRSHPHLSCSLNYLPFAPVWFYLSLTTLSLSLPWCLTHTDHRSKPKFIYTDVWICTLRLIYIQCFRFYSSERKCPWWYFSLIEHLNGYIVHDEAFKKASWRIPFSLAISIISFSVRHGPHGSYLQVLTCTPL